MYENERSTNGDGWFINWGDNEDKRRPWLSPTTDVCNWEKVSCDDDNHQIVYLDLSTCFSTGVCSTKGLGLRGTIPTELAILSGLTGLDLGKFKILLQCCLHTPHEVLTFPTDVRTFPT